jgi:hypothetical protein
LSGAVNVRRRGRAENSAFAASGAGTGRHVDLTGEHGHDWDDPSAPARLNFRGGTMYHHQGERLFARKAFGQKLEQSVRSRQNAMIGHRFNPIYKLVECLGAVG